MRWFVRILLVLVLVIPVSAIGLVAAMFEDRPALTRSVQITPAQTERAQRLLRIHDPRKLPAGVQRTFSVLAEDLDLGLNFVLGQHGGAAKLTLSPGAAAVWISVPAPTNPFGTYLNVEALLRQTAGLPEFDQVRIGRVPVPGLVGNWLLARALMRLEGGTNDNPTSDVLRSVRFAHDFVQVEYQWREDLPERLRAALVAPEERQRLLAYQERLAAVTNEPALPRQVSLGRILTPLMQHAAQRSVQGGASAENRSALLVLAFYVNGRGLSAIVPEAVNWPRPSPRKVTLSERHDFAQHFSISAALAAVAGTPLANAVGIYKEVQDARGGSGFSFPDLAADRAGTLLGERAVRSEVVARSVQSRISAGVVEADFMPPAKDLPEGLSEAEFQRRFGAVDSPRYRAVVGTIEERLGRLGLYR